MQSKKLDDSQKPFDTGKPSRPNKEKGKKEQHPINSNPKADTEKTSYTEHEDGGVDFSEKQ